MEYLVSISANLGVRDVENGGTAGRGNDVDTSVSPAQLEKTLVVGGQSLVGHRHMVVVACGRSSDGMGSTDRHEKY